MKNELIQMLQPAYVVLFVVFHLAGLFTAVRALFTARSSQGAIAWILSALTMPYVAVPLYWVFGRNRFRGYLTARRKGNRRFAALRAALDRNRSDFSHVHPETSSCLGVLERLADMPFTRGNRAILLADGQATFQAIFAAIAQAREYVLVQFYIIRDDHLGRELKNLLIEKAGQGVRVSLLYDEIGCHHLAACYLEDLRGRGVEVRAFNTTRGRQNHFQINFRNHRKIVVVDGHKAFVGGHNVGDEYMGARATFGAWRDTHLLCQGPAASGVQLSFAEDWHWAAGKLPALRWDAPVREDPGMAMLALPSGPADSLETYTLAMLEVIKSARERLWIATPYFVPDREITTALQLAVLRGVDVRVMLPLKADHKLVYLASYSYFPELSKVGVKFFRYAPGFLHQKVLLKDRDLAFVGSANCDNRSFRLNFEITMVVADRGFASQIEAMLARDFTHCRPACAKDYEERWFGFKIAVKLARLVSPIL